MKLNHKGFGFFQQEVVSKQNRKKEIVFFFFFNSVGTKQKCQMDCFGIWSGILYFNLIF